MDSQTVNNEKTSERLNYSSFLRLYKEARDGIRTKRLPHKNSNERGSIYF